MRLGSGVAVFSGLSVLACLAVACSKSSHDLSVGSRSTRVMPGSIPAAEAPQGTTDTPLTPPSAPTLYDPLDYDGAPLSYTVTEIVETSVVHVDPDQRVLEEARIAGAGCFTDVQGGPDVRSAFIRVTVVPSGTVSRAEVGGASEPELLDCLRRVGDGLHFSESQRNDSQRDDSGSESIRSFSIDITLARAH
jgi:hypothetical protein